MEQSDLWHENIYDALGAAVQAGGGKGRVAKKVWPNISATSAEARLRASLNVDHAQKLDPDEFLAIARIGKEYGDHSVMQFLARELGYEITPLKPAEAKKRAKRVRMQSLLDEFKRLLVEVEE